MGIGRVVADAQRSAKAGFGLGRFSLDPQHSAQFNAWLNRVWREPQRLDQRSRGSVQVAESTQSVAEHRVNS